MAFSLRRNSDGGTVGLDIDGRFLAAAQVRDGRLVNLASAELPPGVLADGEVVDRAALTAALKDFVADAKLPRKVQLGVSNQQIVVRMLELPRIEDPSERDAALRFSAAEAIAMPLDEAVLDHQVAGYSGESDEKMRVVVVAARRTMIEEYLAAVKDAGLKAEGIDLDAFALVRMLADGAQATPVDQLAPAPAVPDADPPTAELGGDDGRAEEGPLSVSDYPHLASEEPTAVLPEPEPHPAFAPEPVLAAPYEPSPDAGRVYCHLGGVTNLAIAVGTACYFSRTLSATYDVENAAARVADEIRLSIDYYLAQPNAVDVGDVVLSGAGARNHELVADIGGGLGIPVAVAAPLGTFDASAVPQDDDPHRYTVAAGLAMGAHA